MGKTATEKFYLGTILFSSFLLLSLPGCSFSREKKSEAAKAAPQPVEHKAQEQVANNPHPKELELAEIKNHTRMLTEKLHAFDEETDQLAEEYAMISQKLIELEKAQDELEGKLLHLEVLQKDTMEELETGKKSLQDKIEAIRVQLNEYNALMLKIIDKISSEPRSRSTQ